MKYRITNTLNDKEIFSGTNWEEAIDVLEELLRAELGEEFDQIRFNEEEDTPIIFKLECIFEKEIN